MARNGIDIFYVDESERVGVFVLTSVSVPFLRPKWTRWKFEWNDYYERYRAFRKELRKTHGISATKELHAAELASGRGNYGRGRRQLGSIAGSAVYRWILGKLDTFLPQDSIITATATRSSSLYGKTGLDAALIALFQRMQRTCKANRTNGMAFFDQGHNEYITAYRKARRYLPTGSMHGSWSSGPTKNAPMVNFVKDANFKDSKYSLFVQAADLVAYACSMLRASELGTLTRWQRASQLGAAYDDIPVTVINMDAAKWSGDPRGIVRVS